MSGEGLLIVDRENIVRFVNPPALSLLGCEGNDLLGRPFKYAFAGADATRLNLVGRGGERLRVEVRKMMTSWQGRPASLLSLRDVTERRVP